MENLPLPSRDRCEPRR